MSRDARADIAAGTAADAAAADPVSPAWQFEWRRIALPVATLALGILAWDLVVRIERIPALHPARSGPGGGDAGVRLAAPYGRRCSSP